MEQLPTIIDRYLHLIQEILINSNYQDRATDPWSPPVFDTLKRDRGLDWPQQGLTMIGRIRLIRSASAASSLCGNKSPAISSKPASGAAVRVS